eukprot:gene6420-7696_t
MTAVTPTAPAQGPRGGGQYDADPLEWDVDLEAKAQTRADELATGNASNPSDSYATWPYSGENLAEGNSTQAAVVTAWIEEAYSLWDCRGNYEDVDGISQFTAAQDISAFDNASFEARFKEEFCGEVAQTATVSLSAVRVFDIQAGSVVVLRLSLLCPATETAHGQVESRVAFTSIDNATAFQ